MIRFVSIRHLAVIESLDLELGPGLTVLTGETGAGKSVLVEGIGLLLGGRASADMVRTGAPAAQVQAILAAPDGRDVIVRREVSAEGRSRAFIDDALVTAGALRETVGRWVDLHGQHEHQTLLLPQTHLDLLDRVAGLEALRDAVAHRFDALGRARAAYEATQLDARERAARIDLLSFQLDEIGRVAPVAGEDEQLAATRQVLANADRLQRLAGDAYADLYEREGAALAQLAQVWKRLDDLAGIDTAFAPHVEAVPPIKAQLEDLAYFLRSYLAGLDASPERLQEVEDRLAALERLKRKYGPALTDVLARQAEALRELDALQQGSEHLERLLAARDAAARAYLADAEALSEARAEAGPALCSRLRTELADLAMPRADVSLPVRRVDGEAQWSASGIDVGELYLSANPGEAPRPLARVASGGELSRVMLAITVIDRHTSPHRTLIFDEVDAGIGGRVADAVGARLRTLAADAQVLCVTHLPQVAAHAHHHMHITKEVTGGRTRTSVTPLAPDARVEELARMMAGDTSAPLLEGARRLLHDKAKGEVEAKGESESLVPGESESPISGASKGRKTRGAKVSG
jgi:DNA repair protein RecN (Recombination protein N)